MRRSVHRLGVTFYAASTTSSLPPLITWTKNLTSAAVRSSSTNLPADPIKTSDPLIEASSERPGSRSQLKAHPNASADMPKAGYYAVRVGRNPGIYTTWAECEDNVKGYPGAQFKKFNASSMAESFIGTAGSSASSDPYARSNPPPSSNRYERQAPATSYHSYARPSPPRSSGLYGRDQSQALYTNAHGSYDSSPPPAYSERQAPSASRDAPVNLVRQYEAPRPVVSSSSSRDRQSAASLARDGGFTVTSDGYLAAYCDGSSRNNGRTQAKAGLGVYWGDSGEARQRNLSEALPGAVQTNNRAELLAIIRTLEENPHPDLPLEIRTDSQYSISCMTRWLPKWKTNDFKSSTGAPVKNADLLGQLETLIDRKGSDNVRFKHVRGHAGIHGNDEADRLANLGATLPTPQD